jgi:3-oxoacyl-[acyl-carrier protein] reductase
VETGLRGRVAIVAASSQGLGRAAAEALAAEGAHLALCARNDKSLRSAADAIRRKHKVEVLVRAFDLTHSGLVHAFVGSVAKKFGRIDICVTNAGGPPAGGFLSHSLEAWRKAVELNFLSVVSFCQAVIPHMQRRQWGRILTITSMAVKQPVPELILSNSVRNAVVGLVRSLANEFGKDGILVNNLGPGYTATERLKELATKRSAALGISADEVMQRFADETALKRIAEPREFADLVVFLASERASYLTGQTFLVDGGAYKGL